jgi:RNA polymerase sigma factor (sigma-70 family)
MTDHSVSEWIGQLKQGEADAAQQLWRRYSRRLIEFARRSLRSAPKRMADEEDVVQSVFGSICHAAAGGRFDDVTNRDELWWLLMAITRHKVIDHVRREKTWKRGFGRVLSELDPRIWLRARAGEPGAIERLIGDEPTPDFLAMLQEQHQRLLALLRDDAARKVATARIEGYTVPEIAANLGITTRSVERKLRLIRSKWAKDLAQPT